MTQTSNQTGDLTVDVCIAYFAKIDDDNKVEANIATAVVTIQNVSGQQRAVAQQFCQKIIDSTLKDLQVPGGDERKEEDRQLLNEEAQIKLEGLLPIDD